MPIIHEIHFDPTNGAERIEFVELRNTSDSPIDLSGWFFDKGFKYTFPAGTILPDNEYVVLTQNKGELIARFGTPGTKVHQWDNGAASSLSNMGEDIRLRRADGTVSEAMKYKVGGEWPTTGTLEQSIQLVHPSLDRNLPGAWRAEYPNPGAANGSVFNTQVAGMAVYDNVKHSPKAPTSTNTVIISVEIPQAPTGMIVSLNLSAVLPGNYISLTNSPTEVVSLVMYEINPGIWSTSVPSSFIKHRNLIRYKINIWAPGQDPIVIPAADSPVPNLAFFVYDGISKYGNTDLTGLEQVPVYHLLAKASEVDSWISNGRGNDWPITGTIVHKGKVYDHVRFRAKGRSQRHERIKHNIKIKANKGQRFPHLSDDGEKLADKGTLMLYGGTTAGNEGPETGRMDSGLSEGVALKQFDLLGAPSAGADWAQLRIIDSADENPADPTEGDFWGIYNIVKDYDGEWLKDHDLPQSYIYEWKEFGASEFPPEGPFITTNPTFNAVNYSSRTITGAVHFWRENYDLETQNRFMAANHAIAQQEHAYWGKHYHKMYHHPDRGWRIMPSDMDYTLLDPEHFGHDILRDPITSHPELKVEYLTELRDMLDLFYNGEGIDTFIEQKAAVVHTPGATVSLADIDRERWGLTTNYTNMVVAKASLKQFFHDRALYLEEFAADAALPSTPTISLRHSQFAADTFEFTASAFADPSNQTFRAIQWQVAEVSDPATAIPGEPWHYEAAPTWRSAPIPGGGSTIQVPQGVIQSDTSYRARVRHQNSTGRWSRWSAPQSFLARPAQSSPGAEIIINEIHYNPLTPNGIANADGEFIELYNPTSNTIDLSGYRFVDGVSFTFPAGSSIAPGGFFVIAGKSSEFQRRHGFAPDGDFADGLSNSGERIALADAWGTLIDEVRYDDNNKWGSGADGHGPSLELLDPELENSKPASWVSIGLLDGTPGQHNSLGCESPAVLPEIVINEINYNAAGNGDKSDWVELLNAGTSPVNLEGWRISDGGKSFTLPAHTLPAGAFIVVAENLTWFDPDYPGVPRLGPFAFELGNGGDNIMILNPDNCIVDTLTYEDDSPWEPLADGRGATLSLSSPTADNALAWNWLAGLQGGTPGTDNGHPPPCDPPPPGIVITELNVDSSPFADVGDWIEVYNPTDTFANLSNWRIYDEGGRFDFSGTTFLAPGAYLVIAEDPFAFADYHPGVTVINGQGFTLRGSGERILLTTPSGCIVDEVHYQSQSPWPTGLGGGGTLSLIDPAKDNSQPANWELSAGLGTPGNANDINPCDEIDHANLIFISEISGDVVTIESRNEVDAYSLDGWAIASSESVTPFPNNIVIQPGQSITLGGISVANPDTLELWHMGRCPVDRVTVNDNAINHLPTFPTIAPARADEGKATTIQLNATDVDLNQTLTYRLGAGVPASVRITANNTLVITPTEAEGPDFLKVPVIVSDGFNPPGEATSIFTFEIREVNRPPTLAPIANVTITEKESWSLQLQIADPDIPVNTLKTAIIGGPSGMDISNHILRWVPTFSQSGVYTVGVELTDGKVPVERSFQITVLNSNEAPSFHSAFQPNEPTATERVLYSRDLSAHDPDGDPLAYSLSNAPPGMEIDPNTGTLRWLPTVGQAGAYDFVVSVRDPEGASDTKPISLTVTPAPAPVTSACTDPLTLIPRAAKWAWSDTAIGDGFTKPWFDASTTGWSTGTAPFGYGETVTTTTPSGQIRTAFQTTFSLTEVHTVASLTLQLRRDDAAIIFLNGREVARDNLPAGPIDETIVARSSLFGASEMEYITITLATDALAEGQNTLAVGLHQSTANSNDMQFDLSLEATRAVECPEPEAGPAQAILIDDSHFLSTGSIKFQSVPGRTYVFECCEDLSAGEWVVISTIVGDGSMIELDDDEIDAKVKCSYRIGVVE